MRNENQSGQIGLIVLLTMVVGATIAIAVVTRSVGELKTSRQEKQSTGAFESAETAVEEALSSLTTGPLNTVQTTASGAQYMVQASTGMEMKDVPAGKSLSVNLGNNPNGASVTVNWSASGVGGCPNEPAVVVSIIDQNGGIRRSAIDSCAGSRVPTNDFSPGNSANFSLTASDRLMRVKILYESADIVVSATGNIPNQMYTVNSTARGADGETRSIEAQRGLPMAPSIFDYVLFDGGGDL